MENNKPTFKQRVQYWLDERMSKGTISLIKFLLLGTLLAILLVSLIVSITQVAEESFELILWDNMAYAFNAWIPFAEDGPLVSFLLPTALVSIIGVLFTSILIGIISSAIETKLSRLRKGTSLVLEKDHIVILGFKPGEYTLISEIIESAAGHKITIVVAGDTEKDDMDDLIHANIQIPHNAKIICRNVDICDPNAISCCSIPMCRTVVINPTDDETTVKAVLATISVIDKIENCYVRIVASVKSNTSILPNHMLKHNNIIMLQTRDIVARLIARSCSQHGIARLFDEVLDFKGSEFYVDDFCELYGKTYGELLAAAKEAVPIGLINGKNTIVRPPLNTFIQEGDKIIYFAENRESISFDFDSPSIEADIQFEIPNETNQQIIIFGHNESFDTLIRELPTSIDEITLVDKEFGEDFVLEGKQIKVFKGNIRDEETIKNLIADKEHLVLLNSHEISDYTDIDYPNIVRLIKLRDYKGHYGYHYSITAEMISESSRRLVSSTDSTDYIVASNVSSMILAQLVENHELLNFFSELISNDGNEIYLKSQSQLNIPFGCYAIGELRLKLYDVGYLMLGYTNDNESFDLVMNPNSDYRIDVNKNTYFAVLGEN